MTRISKLTDGTPTQSGDEIAVDRSGTMLRITLSGALSFNGHTHVFADLTDSIADAQVPESAVTQHETALTITESQISDLGNYSVVGHTHAASDVTSGTFADARISESSVTQHSDALPTKFIGEVFALQDDITGVTEPDNSGSIKYIKLTSGLTGAGEYNEGLLITESVSGSSPEVTATAVIDHASSPMDGQTVRLINTEERFLRAGNAGVTQDSQLGSHDHGGATGGNNAAALQLFRSGEGGGSSVEALAASDASGPGTDGGWSSDHIRDNSNHTHPISSAGGNETRPRNVGITYYMRIA